MSADFDGFVRQAWDDHAEQTAAVAQRLASSMHLVQEAAQVAPYAGLIVHVFGVHLAQWSRGAELLDALRATPGHAAVPAAASPVPRGIAALGLAGGDAQAADTLTPPDRIAARAQAASAVAEREDFGRALDLLDAAIAEAARTPLADDSPAVRQLAVAGNNLAAALEDHPGRSPAQTAGMLRAAEAGLAHWRRCGGWLEHQRAEYRMARSGLRAGLPARALQHARQCVVLCLQNDAPAVERFFGHVMVALAAVDDPTVRNRAHDQALAAYEQVPMDEREWCADDLRELQSLTLSRP